MKEKTCGVVSEIIYNNEQNGYTVCAVEGESEEFIAVGSMPGLSPGETVRFFGEWTSHADYGNQFKVSEYENIMPKTAIQILMYLSTGIVKGVGPATAQKIVEKFGDRALDVMRDEPLRLSEIKGISDSKAMSICESLLSKQAMQSLVMFLQPYGVTPSFALRVYKRFGNEAIGKIKQSPYSLCEVEGIGFKTADKIASKMGIEPSDENRLRHGVLYVLGERSQNGDTFLEYAYLVKLSADVLNSDTAAIENTLFYLISQGMLIKETIGDAEAIFIPLFYNAELGAARRLAALLVSRPIKYPGGFEGALNVVQRNNSIELSPLQNDACRLAVEHNALIITGGPGTGKTTVINTLISLMEMAGLAVALCAPTGRAAKRLTETCGMEAKTIHRLLEISFSSGEKQTFSRDESRPLDEDVIIVDEMSMVDILLMNALLKALKPSARIIMAGDADQLPSVGAGDVLRDMLKSRKIPTVRLTEIYRQAAESMIIVNAHRINSGQEPVLNRKDKDFFYMERREGGDILQTIAQLCETRLPAAYGLDPFSDIQVISPARRTQLGVFELNKKLQERLNPPSGAKREKIIGDSLFREGDKVMQVKNNYTISWTELGSASTGEGVFNGDIGVIKFINEHERVIEIMFDDERLVKYDFVQMDEIEHAFAITVHKSQGSEFPAVVMPLYPSAPMLMSRNLLYTALTRAKRLVVLVGRNDVLFKMIKNNGESKRYSGFCDKLEKII